MSKIVLNADVNGRLEITLESKSQPTTVRPFKTLDNYGVIIEGLEPDEKITLISPRAGK